jgi:hypothetical protein
VSNERVMQLIAFQRDAALRDVRNGRALAEFG